MTIPGFRSSDVSQAAPLEVIEWLMAIGRRFWLLLLGAALFAGTWAVVQSNLPSRYVSSALLALSAEQAAEAETIMRAPVVLDAIIGRYPGLKQDTPEEARRRLNDRIEWSAAAAQRKLKPTLFQLDVTDADPARAQQIAEGLIDLWLQQTKPQPLARARIEAEAARVDQQIIEASALIGKLQGEAKQLVAPNSLQGELAGPLIRLIAERDQLVTRLTGLREALSGVNREIVVSPPTRPFEDSKQRHRNRNLLIAAAVGLVAGALLALLLEWLARFRLAVPTGSRRDQSTS